MSYSLIDTHCHLDLIEKEGQPISVSLEKSNNSGIKKIIQIGVNLERSILAKEIAHKTQTPVELYFTAGCHPSDDFDQKEIEETAKLIENSVSDPKFVGVGEIGLDYYHKKDNLEFQQNSLRQFLQLASENSLPVVIHSRDAADDTYRILEEFKGKCFGVLHCFAYDAEYAKKFVDLGYYISFSGIVTFKNATGLHEAARQIPLESILIETDSPYLAPHPHRGKMNDPSYLPIIMERICHLRNEPAATVERRIFENSMNFIHRKGF